MILVVGCPSCGRALRREGRWSPFGLCLQCGQPMVLMELGARRCTAEELAALEEIRAYRVTRDALATVIGADQ